MEDSVPRFLNSLFPLWFETAYTVIKIAKKPQRDSQRQTSSLSKTNKADVMIASLFSKVYF